MKKALLITIGALLISGCSRWSAPTEKMAKDYLQSKEYDVLEFKKINGIKGAGEYTLMYTAKINFKEDKGWPISEWEAGETRIWAGEILFKNSENGWLPTGNSIKTSTHDSGGKTEALRTLAGLRSALQVFYGDTQGVFPTTLEELSKDRKYIAEIPFIQLGGHARTNSVKYIDSNEINPKDFTDTGGWVYYGTNKNSATWGTLMFDCTHKDLNGNFRYPAQTRTVFYNGKQFQSPQY